MPRPPSGPSEFNDAYRAMLERGCKRQDLTRAEVATQLGVSRQNLGHPMRQRNSISLESLQALFEILGCESDERRELSGLWVVERLTSGSYAKATDFILRSLRAEVGEDRFLRLMSEAASVQVAPE